MALPPLVIPGAFLVNLIHTCGGKTVENVIGVKAVGVGGPDAEAVASAVGNAWKAANGPLSKHSSAVTFTTVHVVDLQSTTGAVVEHSYSQVGGQTGADLATMAACALISWHGGTRSRRGNGRMYFGPMMENHINSDGRTIESSFQTGLNTAMAQFKADLETASLQWATISRVGLTATPVVNPTCQGTIATQRRRLR